MANDIQDSSHDEGRLGAVLDAAQAGHTAIAGNDGSAGFPQIADVIADYQQASSGYEIDLSALFDTIADRSAIDEIGSRLAMAESPSGGGAGDEIDLGVLFDGGGEANGQAGSAQVDVALPAGVNSGGDGFATFTAAASHPGAVNALYGDDNYDHTGTVTG